MSTSASWRRRGTAIASVLVALAMLAPGSAAMAKSKKKTAPPAPDVCSGVLDGHVITFTPLSEMKFNVDLGAYDTGVPQPSCAGWDYTLSAYGTSDTSLPAVGSRTIQGDGQTLVLQYDLNLDYSKLPTGTAPGGTPPGTSVWLVETIQQHGSSTVANRVPDAGGADYCSSGAISCPSSSFH
jgi:hypothetical protein